MKADYLQQRTEGKQQSPGRVRASRILQRKCACGGTTAHAGECEECKKKKLQRRANGAATKATAPPIVHDVLRSSGQPLGTGTRSFFESQFGHDFGKVRVHTDARAAESARAVNAQAYTVGSSMVFGLGRFSPQSISGQALLAHELTHVMQQSDHDGHASVSSLEIGAEDDAAERQAESTARRVTTSPSTREDETTRSSGIKLQRQPAPGGEEEKKDKYVPPLFQVGDYGIDFKPTIPGPIGLPSIEDVHQGLGKLGQKDRPASLTCPTGWSERYEGLCCPGTSVDVDRCCPVSRMTALGLCCPEGKYAQGTECIADTPPSSGLSVTKQGGKAPEGKASMSIKLPPMTPLTVDLAIHFNQGQPASAVASEKTLRTSLTSRGQGELDQVLNWLKRDPNSSVQLTGMASIEGTKAQNEQLGRDRARSVAYVLMASGVDVHRFSDPPGLPAACADIGVGLHSCGDSLASPAKDENDRQVRVRLFTAPKGTVVSATSP